MKNQQKNKQPMDAPIQHAGTVSASSNGSRKDSIPDVQHVRNLIERCLMLNMNRDEVVNTLLTRENIHPIFTNAVWEKLEEEKKEFFMKIHVAPIANRVRPRAPAMRYPVQQHPQMHVTGHPHVVKGVPLPATSKVIPPSSSGGVSEKAVSPDDSMVDSDVGGGGGAGNSRDSVDQFDWMSISIEQILSFDDLPSVEELDKFLAELFDSDKDKPLS